MSSASWFCEKSETFSTLSSYFQTASRSPRASSSTRCSPAGEDFLPQFPVQCRSTTAKFYEQSQRNRSVPDFNRRVLLTNAIFVDHKVVAPDVGMKYPFGSCTRSFMVTIRLAGSKSISVFCLPCLPLDERSGRAIWNLDLSAGCLLRILARCPCAERQQS